MSDQTFSAKDVPSQLMPQTLLDRNLVKVVDRPITRLMPDLNIVLLGGRSILDRGGEVVLSLVDEARNPVRSSRSWPTCTPDRVAGRAAAYPRQSRVPAQKQALCTSNGR